VLEKRQPLVEAHVSGGTQRMVPLGVAEDIELLMPRSAADVVTIKISYRGPLKAPVAAGDKVGMLSVLRSDQLTFEAPVIALEDSPLGSLSRRAIDNSWDWVVSLFRRSPSKS
jgi:D-alanyl-D-alanine carboxypeptidase (penicillin-binding protein 5/6)